MAFDKIVISSLVNTTKNSIKMNNAVDSLKERAIDSISSQIEKQIPIPLPFNTREILTQKNSLPSNLLTPETITSLVPPDTLSAVSGIPNEQKEQINNTLNNIENILNVVIQQKNNIQGALNVIIQPLDSLEKLSNTLSGVVTGLQVTVTTIKLLPIPTSVPPGIGIPLNVINGFSDALDTLKKVLDKIEGPIKVIPSVIQQINNILSEISNKLALFDPIFSQAISIITLIRLLVNFGGNVTQEQIDQTLEETSSKLQESIAASNGFLISSSNGDANKETDTLLLSQLDPNSNNPLFYKNFKLEIQYNNNNQFSFPSRRIKGKNINNNQILYNENNGNYSFSSSTQVLLDEIKFQIDQLERTN
jgi:archaellum component FlaC